MLGVVTVEYFMGEISRDVLKGLGRCNSSVSNWDTVKLGPSLPPAKIVQSVCTQERVVSSSRAIPIDPIVGTAGDPFASTARAKDPIGGTDVRGCCWNECGSCRKMVSDLTVCPSRRNPSAVRPIGHALVQRFASDLPDHGRRHTCWP